MSSSVAGRSSSRAFPTSPARSMSTSRSFQHHPPPNGPAAGAAAANNSRAIRSSSNPRSVQSLHSGVFPPNLHTQNTREDLSNLIDDDDLKRFKTHIEESPVDEWRTRTIAFEILIASIPEVRQSAQTVIPKWYQSAQAVARLANPLSALILDARSTVVKHTCQHIELLVQRCNLHTPPNSDVCRYLLRDLFPSVLNLSAQTVNVIRNYAVDMMCKLIPMCRFKSGLPFLLDRLRFDKSRDVREACVRYLKLILQNWCGTNAFSPDSDVPQAYLSKENCMHIGKALAYSLSDPSQTVRMEARQSFELFRGWYPDQWSEILHDPDGVFHKDMKLKKTLLDSASRLDAGRSVNFSSFGDDWTVGTNESRNSDSVRSSSVIRQHEAPLHRVGPPHSRPPGTTGIRGPPLRLSDQNPYVKLPPKAEALKGLTPKASSQFADLLSIPTDDALVTESTDSWDKSRDSIHRKQQHQQQPVLKEIRNTAARKIQAAFRGYLARTFIHSTPRPIATIVLEPSSNSKSPFIGIASMKSAHPKKEFSGDDSIGSILSQFQSSSLEDHGVSLASSYRCDSETTTKTKSRNSSMLLIKRLQKCGTSTSSINHDNAITDQHVIANQLLAAHKAYIDEFMDCLQAEMKLIKNFEEIMKSSRSSHCNRPSEEDVISYFESVYQLLDKETHNSNTLRSALVRISQGERM